MTRLPLLILAAVFSITTACSIDDSALKVGMKAPSLQTKTLADVNGDFSRITTYRYPDERMYQMSLDQALNSDKTIVLEFATPGHCTICDKQLQMLKALLAKYEDQIIFLHMDQYQNPQAFKAFGVIGDPWTYVIDKTQTVRFKQAGRMLYNELDFILNGLLNESQDAKQQVAEAG
ncbi:TlpA family protein disulfide reductase [Kaarinaea lacus]